jgi:hypothetical protein
MLTVSFHITWLVWLRTEPLTHVQAPGCLVKLAFWHLTLSTPKRCHMDLWLAWLVLTRHHHRRLHTQTPFCNNFTSDFTYNWELLQCLFYQRQILTLEVYSNLVCDGNKTKLWSSKVRIRRSEWKVEVKLKYDWVVKKEDVKLFNCRPV